MFLFMDKDALSLLVNQTLPPSSGGVSELGSVDTQVLKVPRWPPTYLKYAARIG